MDGDGVDQTLYKQLLVNVIHLTHKRLNFSSKDFVCAFPGAFTLIGYKDNIEECF